MNSTSENIARKSAVVRSHEAGYVINQETIMLISGICCVDKAIRFLFWQTCHALEGDRSKIKAARGDRNTGGRFS